MSEQTPQDAREIAQDIRAAAWFIANGWLGGQPEIVRNGLAADIADELQAERERQAAMVAQAKIDGLAAAAAAICYRCAQGAPVHRTPRRGHVHVYGNSRFSCPAHEIHLLANRQYTADLIAKGEAANVSP